VDVRENRNQRDEDLAWASAHQNAVDELFPGVEVLTVEQDAICIARANEEIAWS